MVYLDDIVVYSRSFEDHMLHLCLVFQHVSENTLFVKKEKYRFCVKEIKFLVQIVGVGTVWMDPQKFQAINEWPTSFKVNEL